jgi:Mg2+/citrate symporter
MLELLLIVNVIWIIFFTIENIIYEYKVRKRRKVWKSGDKTPIDKSNNVHNNHKYRKKFLFKLNLIVNFLLLVFLIMDIVIPLST